MREADRHFLFEIFQKDENNINRRKIVKTGWKTGIVLFMCDVEEITDWRGEELREEIELCANTEAEELEEPQEQLKLFTTQFTHLAFRESAAGISRCG